MDTRSKKYKRIRLVCFLLCLVCVGTSAFAVCRGVVFGMRAGYFYGTQNFCESLHDTRRSTYFLNEVGLAYYSVRRAFVAYNDGRIFDSEDFIKSFEEKRCKEIEKRAKESIKRNEAFVTEYNEAHAKDPDVNELLLDYYGWIYVWDVTENGKYIADEDNFITINEEYFYRQAENELGDVYSLDAYENEYKHLASYVSRLSALEYFLVDNTTGAVYTNSGCETVEQFRDRNESSTWFVSSDDNFESVTVSDEFKAISDSANGGMYRYQFDSEDIARTSDGIILNNSNYLYEFFSSIRYGYYSYMESLGYIVGPTDLFKAGPCTVYLSFDYGRAGANDPFERIYSNYAGLASNLERDIFIGLAALVILIVLTVLVLYLAGKKPVKLNWQNRIPGEIHLVLSLGAAVGGGVLAGYFGIGFFEKHYHMISTAFVSLWMAGAIAFAVVCYAFVMNGLITLVQSVRGGVFVKRLLIVQPFRFAAKGIRRLRENNTSFKNGVRHQFKIIVPVYLLVSALCWLFLANCYDGVLNAICIGLLVLINVVFFVVLYYYAKSLDKIRETVAKSQQGDFDVQFNCNSMPRPMVGLAQDISEMREGMKVAIDSAVRDQRTKAELITNVSHDIKTPLTSIITYSDLIGRSDTTDETVSGYTQVLIEKSMRLKQLIEDLTEATKASTGAVDLQPVQVSLCELVAQAIGENADAFERSGIDVRYVEGAEQPVVIADGQKTYRVLENIISNITKYGMPGTRAYVSVGIQGNMGTVTFRNISKEPLNISVDELMERFVRGDSSRSGEGSGLGLSIAKDLCLLQGGSFEIKIEGDMFTSEIMLPLKTE